MRIGNFPATILVLTAINLVSALAAAQELPAQVPPPPPPPPEELLPSPRSTDPPEVRVGPGDWVDPQGGVWKFDGLRWRVLWENGKWYPVIPPGPLPCWQKENFGKGWTAVLPPGSSTWHVIPPSMAFMPPPGPPLGPPPAPPPTVRNWRCFKRWQAH